MSIITFQSDAQECRSRLLFYYLCGEALEGNQRKSREHIVPRAVLGHASNAAAWTPILDVSPGGLKPATKGWVKTGQSFTSFYSHLPGSWQAVFRKINSSNPRKIFFRIRACLISDSQEFHPSHGWEPVRSCAAPSYNSHAPA